MTLFKNKKAFTLTELIVGITITAILFIGTSNTNLFNKISEKEELQKIHNSIKNHYESIRNNALIGKGIGVVLDIPDEWSIGFSTTNSGTVISSYSGTVFLGEVEYKNQLFKKEFSITKIDCLKFDGSDNDIGVGAGSIILKNSKVYIGSIGCTLDNSKILKIETKYITKTGSFQINTLNGLFEIN